MYILAVTHFEMQFTHVFFRENCFENVVSDVGEKMFPQNYFKKKVQKLKTTKNHESVHNLWRRIRTKLFLFFEFLRPHFKNSFS